MPKGMNKSKIEWCDYTWNPVTGCLHNCPYCYARGIGLRFEGHFNPTFHPDRLEAPKKLKKPSKIFVGSMTDMMGNFIQAEWIDKSITAMFSAPQHTYQMLTKRPENYKLYHYPKGTWLGMTITGEACNALLQSRLDELRKLEGDYYKFVSIEPLLGTISKFNFKGIDLMIIGAQTGRRAKPPQDSWIEDVISIPMPEKFWKSNIRQYSNKLSSPPTQG